MEENFEINDVVEQVDGVEDVVTKEDEEQVYNVDIKSGDFYVANSVTTGSAVKIFAAVTGGFALGSLLVSGAKAGFRRLGRFFADRREQRKKIKEAERAAKEQLLAAKQANTEASAKVDGQPVQAEVVNKNDQNVKSNRK